MKTHWTLRTTVGVMAAALALLGPTGCEAAPRARIEEVAVVTFAVAADASTSPADAGVGLAHEDARRVDHLARASRLEQAGDAAGALLEARRAAFDRPGLESLRAVARLADRDPRVRVQAHQALAEAQPGEAAPLIQLARTLLAAQMPAEALTACDRALAIAPPSAEVLHLRGLVHLRTAAPAAAAADFEQAVRLNPQHAWALNNLGYAQLLLGRADRAIAPLERARALAPHLAYVHNNLGAALEQVGRLAEAQLCYGKALELEPEHPRAASNFARAAEALGWAGPLADDRPPELESEPDAGRPAGDWAAREFGEGEGARAWLLEAGAKAPGDDPSGADLRDDPAGGDLGSGRQGFVLGFRAPEEP